MALKINIKALRQDVLLYNKQPPFSCTGSLVSIQARIIRHTLNTYTHKQNQPVGQRQGPCGTHAP